MKQRVVIINQALSNHGDEAAHKGLVRMLTSKYPDAEITVLMHIWPGMGPDDYSLFCPEELKRTNYLRVHIDRSFRITIKYLWWLPAFMLGCLAPLISRNLRKIRQTLRSANLIVNAPGGVDLGPYRNWANLFRLLLSLQSGNPTAIYSISFGPLPSTTPKDRRFSILTKHVLSQVQFLSLRDDKSQQYAKDIHIDYFPSADTAFLDDTEHQIPPELTECLLYPYSVFVPNALFQWHPNYPPSQREAFEGLYKSILDLLLGNDLHVVMLPQLFGTQNDEAYFQNLSKGFPESRVTVIPDRYSSEIQQAIIRNAEILVGARYHSVVFSIKNRIPFIALSYEHKISNLLTMAGLHDLMLDLHEIQNLTPESIREKILFVLKNRNAIKKRVAGGHSKVLDIAQRTSKEFNRRFPLKK